MKEGFYMFYQQLHAGKVKLNGLGGMRHHLLDRERVRSNPNIDISRSHLNHAIENLSPENLTSRVRERIKQLNLKRKLRTDAVGLEDIIIGASVDFMLQLDPQAKEQFFKDSLHFIQEKFGKENVMYCYCHMDESNPHIHIGVVPVTSDGRLSARDIFTPKSLESLQTAFHNIVGEKYGLARGEKQHKKYLELNQFKAQQAKLQLEQYTKDLDTAVISQNTIRDAEQSAHYATSGVIFTSKDMNTTQLPTKNYSILKQAAEEGAKATALVNSLKTNNAKLRREKFQYLSDSNDFLHQWKSLQDETKLYTAVPKAWRKNIDVEIDKLQKLFTKYCHDVNRMTAKVFIATNKDLMKTENLMRNYIKNTGIKSKDIHKYTVCVIKSARKQLKNNIKPEITPSSWKYVHPSNTDYQKTEQTGLVSVKLVDLSGNDIDWDMINWDLISELKKDELETKEMLKSI